MRDEEERMEEQGWYQLEQERYQEGQAMRDDAEVIREVGLFEDLLGCETCKISTCDESTEKICMEELCVK
jgi:hypothetical protein